MRSAALGTFVLATACLSAPAWCADVALLRHPAPFRASLAISSDCDETDSVEEFLGIGSFLAGTDPTPWGQGLGLEIGGSFWFFDPTGHSSFTYCSDLDGTPSEAALVIEAAIASGHLDVLHTWGDFSQGGFLRRHAEVATAHLRAVRERTGVSVETWVNHGNPQNRQRIGRRPIEAGDDPDAPEYHMDLAREAGIRYAHGWEITHIVGQGRPYRIRDRAKMLGEHAADLLGRLKGRPSYPRRSGNDLVFVKTLDDGSRVWGFRRLLRPWFGGASATMADLPSQIPPRVLDELESTGGTMILYTHLGANGEEPDGWLSPEAIAVLRDVAERSRRGDLFVTTTTRLLRLEVARSHLVWTSVLEEGRLVIDVTAVDDPVSGRRAATLGELMGVGFDIPGPAADAVLRVCGRDVTGDAVRGGALRPDGRSTISFAWVPMQWPFGGR